MVIESRRDTDDLETFDVVCDGVVNSRTTYHDPRTTAYESLQILVEGDGPWAVALADTTTPLPDEE